MYPGMAYGNREVFLSHAGLSWMRRLPVAVQHGWFTFAAGPEIACDPPEVWVWSERIARDFERFLRPEQIRIVGSYFCYLYNALKPTLPACDPKGSIVIPSHSAGDVDYQYATADYARRLNELPDEYKPIRVMIHFLDIEKSYVDDYRKYGFEVVCNGTGNDFIQNFIKNVHGKGYCVFPELGSGVFYALYMGLKPLHMAVDHTHTNQGNIWIASDGRFTDVNIRDFNEAMIPKLSPSLVEEELGVRHLLSPREMRRALFRNYFSRKFLMHFGRKAVRKLAASTQRMSRPCY